MGSCASQGSRLAKWLWKPQHLTGACSLGSLSRPTAGYALAGSLSLMHASEVQHGLRPKTVAFVTGHPLLMLCLRSVCRQFKAVQVLSALLTDTLAASCSTMATAVEPVAKKAKSEYTHSREVRCTVVGPVTIGRYQLHSVPSVSYDRSATFSLPQHRRLLSMQLHIH